MPKSREQIEALRERAYAAQGWKPDGSRDWAADDDRDYTDRVRDRAFSEGVEAALLWVTGAAGEPPLPAAHLSDDPAPDSGSVAGACPYCGADAMR
jgi:hypothetical protein